MRTRGRWRIAGRRLVGFSAAPVLPVSALVDSGTQITITFSGPVTSLASSPTGWTIAGIGANGVGSATASGSTIILAIAIGNVSSGDTVTISYAGGGDQKDSFGRLIAPFSNLRAVNPL